MNRTSVVDRFKLGVVAGVVMAFGLIGAAPANSEPRVDNVTIAVFADRYVVADRAFDDLNLVEKHITATHVRDVLLLVCGPQATRSLKAVVHRFRQLPLQIRVPDLDERDCMSKAPAVLTVGARVGQRPFGIDDAAVERYWLDIMP